LLQSQFLGTTSPLTTRSGSPMSNMLSDGACSESGDEILLGKRVPVVPETDSCHSSVKLA
jgi:hypothetical protein